MSGVTLSIMLVSAHLILRTNLEVNTTIILTLQRRKTEMLENKQFMSKVIQLANSTARILNQREEPVIHDCSHAVLLISNHFKGKSHLASS